MTNPEFPGDFDAKERSLLASAIPPLPLDEARVEATLRLAGRRVRRRRLARHAVRLSTAASVAFLLAAGYWRWSGANIHEQLTFGRAMDVAGNPEGYEWNNVQAAAGKIAIDLLQLFGELRQSGQMTPAMQEAVTRAIDSPQRIAVDYQGDFEELRWKVQDGQRLDAPEMERLIRAVCSGLSSFREIGESNPDRYARFVRGICKKLRDDVTGDRFKPKPATGESEPAGH